MSPDCLSLERGCRAAPASAAPHTSTHDRESASVNFSWEETTNTEYGNMRAKSTHLLPVPLSMNIRPKQRPSEKSAWPRAPGCAQTQKSFQNTHGGLSGWKGLGRNRGRRGTRAQVSSLGQRHPSDLGGAQDKQVQSPCQQSPRRQAKAQRGLWPSVGV